MGRPSLKRALQRAGVMRQRPEPLPAGPRNRGVPPPPLVFLPGETVVPEPPPVDLGAFFGRQAPLELEIGPGRARFLLARAAEHPERDFLGAEVEAEYALIAQARADRVGLLNVRFVRLDGKGFVRRLPLGSLSALHVYFPDPWPKKRHHKRRLFDAAFAADAARALAPGALLRAASDHLDYWEVIREVLDAEPGLAGVDEEEAGEWAAGTNYEAKFVRQGREIRRGIWRRRGTA